MDRGSQPVAAALSQMQERDGLRSRVGGRSQLVRSDSLVIVDRGACSPSGAGAPVASAEIVLLGSRGAARGGLGASGAWGLGASVPALRRLCE
jgi:hypothetical protein